ncbi:deoxyribonuclease [Candidatus Bathyarchaeota archaeon]|nr:MAG: deoxyribonuclease [Candidatus Bathyarchaeota archaeon]
MSRRKRPGVFRPRRPLPVAVGEEHEVEIEEMSRRGDAGVARIEGLIIFVPGTRPGQHVRIRIIRVGRNYAVAQVV